MYILCIIDMIQTAREYVIIEIIVRVNVFIMIQKVQANLVHSKPSPMLTELNEQQ